VLLTGSLLFAGGGGLRPRADVNEYPTRSAEKGIALGAALLSKDQVKKSFATELAG
jgi:hypothetical protein